MIDPRVTCQGNFTPPSNASKPVCMLPPWLTTLPHMRPLPLLLLALAVSAGEVPVPIANPLNLDWPWELVHRDLPAGTLPTTAIATGMGEPRPVQVETLPDGQQRAWFIATVPRNPDRKGTSRADVVLKPGEVPTTLTVSEHPDHLEIANGVLRLRLARFTGAFATTRKLNELPPPLIACQVQGDAAWYGHAWFEGDHPVTAARTEVLSRGPVFTTVRVTYEIAGAEPAPPGNIAPLAPGAPWPPPRSGCFIQSTWRIVAGSVWVQVEDQHRLPTPATSWLELKDGLKPDTALWIRWFGYEAFGGNVDLKAVPLEPQPKQRGPFVALRPRWSQAPGGGQDFVATRGGEKADPTTPAVGLVATHASRWVDPYAQTINVFAENRDTAKARFGWSQGSRSWALLVGGRGNFDDTGKLNGVVRRHSDWTLDKQLNDYVLEWERDPTKAGPTILLTRERLAAMRAEWASGKDTPTNTVLKEFVAKQDAIKGVDRTLLDLITGATTKAGNPPSPDLWLQRRYQDDFLNPTGQTRRMKAGWPAADLTADGKPLGGAAQAAIGYIFSDLDQWPGYHNGWGPGNPNFHTDKYLVAAFTAAALRDHPHAGRWLTWARHEFDQDVHRVLLPGDGVGFECPGYSTYALGLLLELATVFENTGHGNPVAENPLFKKTGVWHRHLLTPHDPRIGIRHQAPIGDTHRWGGKDGEVFGALARFYKTSDPAFASELMGIWKLYRDQGMRGTVLSDVVNVDQSITPTAPERLDWQSRSFLGFGAVMRSGFASERETFATFRAGSALGHAHNEQLSFHFYGAGLPIALDYNCSYHPRGDHAALHNTMTFGQARPFTHQGDSEAVPAMEQAVGAAKLAAFASTPVADAAVAEMAVDRLVLSPVEPQHAKFQYPYPTRDVPRLVHRRFQVLVKHPAGSPLSDYLVIRDETISREAQHTNLHLLSRAVSIDGNRIRATGQLGADIDVFLATPTAPKVEVGRWFYYDEWMSGPGKWKLAGKGHDPAQKQASDEENAAWIKMIHDSDGRALIPPVGWSDKWEVGEYQQWLRIDTAPGQALTWVVYPRRRGEPEPTFAILDGGTGVAVSVGNTRDEIHLATTPAAGIAGQVVVRQGDISTVVLGPSAVPALGEVKGEIPAFSGRVIDDASPAAQR